RLRENAIKQARQRDVDDEEVHPCEARFRDLLVFAASEPKEDQAEEREREIDHIEHVVKFVRARMVLATWRRGCCYPPPQTRSMPRFSSEAACGAPRLLT